MKILFPLIKAGSGSDIFIDNLRKGLNNADISSTIQYFPQWSGFIPLINRFTLDTTGFDVVHSNTWNGYAFRADIPLVVTGHSAVRLPEHSKYQSISQKAFYKLVSKWEMSTISSADVVCCVSRFAASYLEQMYDYHDAKVIYNGIDTDIFSPSDPLLNNHQEEMGDKEINLFFAGNRRIMKGFDLLPKIMNELGEGFHLKVAAGLRSNTSKPLHKKIQDLGKVMPQKMPFFYQNTDIYLFPTRLEGFGLSVAEAMACGKPIVTTNCSSLPELVVDGKGGYLCPIDDVSAFAEAIRHLAEDENLRKYMGLFNRQRVIEKFSLEKMTWEYIQVYDKIII